MTKGYFDSAVKWWDGTKWRPGSADWLVPTISRKLPTSIATSITLNLSATTINSGQSVTISGNITGASSGSVQIYRGGGLLKTVTAGSGAYSTTDNPSSSSSYYAVYVANGNFLGSTSGTQNVTVRTAQYYTVRSSSYGVARNGYQWGMSGAPHTLQSTFNVGGGQHVPSGATITGARIEVAAYYARSDAINYTGGIYNSGGGAISTVTRTDGKAGGTDTPLMAFDFGDFAPADGGYRIGFSFPATSSIQWDYDSSAPGFTFYADGGATGSKSLLWEIDYYVWA